MSGPAYPIQYECFGCDRETEVDRSDARSLYSDPDSMNAPKVVLEQRGWIRGKADEMLFCPDCVVANGTGTSTPY